MSVQGGNQRPSPLAVVAPGILLAATGVGAGDLLTTAIAGSAVGLSILWAVPAGVMLKYVLTEGIARWQMGTGTSLLEGWGTTAGRGLQGIFLAYLLLWSFFVGGALISACGAAGAALFPVFDNGQHTKTFWGTVHAASGYLFVRLGGYRLFEKIMSALVGLMFVTVIVTALLTRPAPGEVLRGFLVPSLPEYGLGWVLGVIGGVGGTLTLLSYGYWIREEGRSGRAGLRLCRVDLALGYLVTALFGVSMIVIGSRVEIEKNPNLVLELAGHLESLVGSGGRWVFLLGFWGAVFSSLLGVWQSVPYLFADITSLWGKRASRPAVSSPGLPASDRRPPLRETRAYRGYLLALTLAPLPLLWVSIQHAQLVYAVVGALFMPLLALSLLFMNNRTEWVGRRFRNGRITNAALVVTLGFFLYVAARQLADKLGPLVGM
jgi:Mn2+/Fe2+ NRAMP family transporter